MFTFICNILGTLSISNLRLFVLLKILLLYLRHFLRYARCYAWSCDDTHYE